MSLLQPEVNQLFVNSSYYLTARTMTKAKYSCLAGFFLMFDVTICHTIETPFNLFAFNLTLCHSICLMLLLLLINVRLAVDARIWSGCSLSPLKAMPKC